MILRSDQRWQPVSETVKSYRLEEIEDCQHDSASAVWRMKDLGKTLFAHVLQRRRLRHRQRMAKVGLCMPVKNRGHAFCFSQVAVSDKPAW